MYFTGIYVEVLYIIVSAKLHIGNNIDKGRYYYDVLYYKTVTWCNCDNATITQYSVYPMNLYDNLSIGDEQKKGKCYPGWIR